ncbi:MAG: hypothetical protein M3Q65_19995, partial [Chloroflexota bacterium]|nr:hypothetical protein [Chloroflexota bacterium]
AGKRSRPPFRVILPPCGARRSGHRSASRKAGRPVAPLANRLRLALAIDVVDQDVLAEALGLGEEGMVRACYVPSEQDAPNTDPAGGYEK